MRTCGEPEAGRLGQDLVTGPRVLAAVSTLTPMVGKQERGHLVVHDGVGGLVEREDRRKGAVHGRLEYAESRATVIPGTRWHGAPLQEVSGSDVGGGRRQAREVSVPVARVRVGLDY